MAHGARLVVRPRTYETFAMCVRDSGGAGPGDDFAIPAAARAVACCIVMESQSSPAEDLPALYRGILDGVAQLEEIGQRREAALVRAEATRIYSRSWDAGGRRQLEQVQRRIDRIRSGQDRPRRDRGRSWRPFQRLVSVR